jgi:hypothetical protein
MAGESGTGTVNQVASPVGTSSSMIATPENEVKQLDAYKAGTLPAYMFNRSMTNPLSVAQYNQQVAGGGPLMNMPTGTAIIRGKVFSTEPGGQSTFGPNVFRTAGDAQLEALKLPSNWNDYNAAQKIDYYNRNNITADKLLSAGAAQSDIDWMLNNGYTGKNWDGTTPSGWKDYTAQQKISFFNNNNVSPDRLKELGVPQSDIDWMLANGYTVKSVTAPLANNTNNTSNNNNTVVNTNNNNTNTTTVKNNLSPDGRGYITVGGASYSVLDGNKKPPGNWTWSPPGDTTPGMWIPSSGNVNTNKPAGTNIGTGGPITYMADGTTNVKGYYNGTMGVKGYANGTTGNEEDDIWNWTSKKDQVVAPSGSNITASTEQAGAPVPDKTEQFLGQQAQTVGLNAAAKGVEAGYKAFNAPLTTQAASSLGTTASGAPVALANVGSAPASAALVGESGLVMPSLVQGASLTAAPIGGAGLGITGASAAPIGSAIGTGIAGAAEGAALSTAAGSTAATGLTGTLGAGGSAMMTALASNPIGWAIGAGVLAKKLGVLKKLGLG